jgi:hypothetical protein
MTHLQINNVTIFNGCPSNIVEWQLRYARVSCAGVTDVSSAVHDVPPIRPSVVTSTSNHTTGAPAITSTTQASRDFNLDIGRQQEETVHRPPSILHITESNAARSGVTGDDLLLGVMLTSRLSCAPVQATSLQVLPMSLSRCQSIADCLNATVADKLIASDAFLKALQQLPRVRLCDADKIGEFIKWNRRLNEILEDKYKKLATCIGTTYSNQSTKIDTVFSNCQSVSDWPTVVSGASSIGEYTTLFCSTQTSVQRRRH